MKGYYTAISYSTNGKFDLNAVKTHYRFFANLMDTFMKKT
jgi:hypothetical protein